MLATDQLCVCNLSAWESYFASRGLRNQHVRAAASDSAKMQLDDSSLGEAFLLSAQLPHSLISSLQLLRVLDAETPAAPTSSGSSLSLLASSLGSSSSSSSASRAGTAGASVLRAKPFDGESRGNTSVLVHSLTACKSRFVASLAKRTKWCICRRPTLPTSGVDVGLPAASLPLATALVYPRHPYTRALPRGQTSSAAPARAGQSALSLSSQPSSASSATSAAPSFGLPELAEMVASLSLRPADDVVANQQPQCAWQIALTAHFAKHAPGGKPSSSSSALSDPQFYSQLLANVAGQLSDLSYLVFPELPSHAVRLCLGGRPGPHSQPANETAAPSLMLLPLHLTVVIRLAMLLETLFS